jgi:hypothetical protein
MTVSRANNTRKMKKRKTKIEEIFGGSDKCLSTNFRYKKKFKEENL